MYGESLIVMHNVDFRLNYTNDPNVANRSTHIIDIGFLSSACARPSIPTSQIKLILRVIYHSLIDHFTI